MAEIHTTETKTTIDLPRAPRPEPDADSSLLSNILMIVGAIIIVVIALWGLFHLFSLARPWFSSLFPVSAPSIQVSAPAQVTSGTPFALSWKNSQSTTGSYSLLYQCQQGVELAVPAQNNAFAVVTCGKSYSLTGATSSVEVLPLFSGTASTSVPVSVVFAPNNSNSPIQGSATITINANANMQPIQQPSQTTTTKTPTPSTTAPVYSGPADLSVRVISAVMNGNGTGSVSFDIANVGGSPSGTYYFSAQLPLQTPYTYQSQAQASLAPGAHIVDTLNFTQGIYGGSFYVTVNPAAGETNVTNNGASTVVY